MVTLHGIFSGDESEARALVSTIKGILFDVDGVFTDNRVVEGGDAKPKSRSYYDGQGVSLLRAVGIRVCLVTNEKGASAKHIEDVVENWNNLPSSKKWDAWSSREYDGMGIWERAHLFTGMGGAKKVVAAEQWFAETGLDWSVCAAMGDDLVDVDMLKRSMFRAAPASGELVIREFAHFVSKRPGGYGAVRDLANFILEMKGIDPLSVPPQ